MLASIVLATDGHQQAAVAVSDGAGPVEDLQFTLGEGPGVGAHAEGRHRAGRRPRQAGDPLGALRPRGLGPRCAGGVRSRCGRARSTPACCPCTPITSTPSVPTSSGNWRSSPDVTDAVLAMQSGARTEELAWSLANAADHRAVVHQATGMVAMQVECSARDALARLRATAFTDGTTVDEVAPRVVERRCGSNDDDCERHMPS